MEAGVCRVKVYSNAVVLPPCFLCTAVSILKAGIQTSKYLLILSFLSGVAFLISEQLLGADIVRDWPFCYYKIPPMTFFLLFEGPLLGQY